MVHNGFRGNAIHPRALAIAVGRRVPRRGLRPDERLERLLPRRLLPALRGPRLRQDLQLRLQPRHNVALPLPGHLWPGQWMVANTNCE